MSQKEIIEKITNRFYNDIAGFSTAFTDIFKERDGSNQAIYGEQLEFMNMSKPTDRVTSVVKCRQCLHPDTVIETENEFITIKELYERFQKGEKFKVWTIDEKSFPVLDDVKDVWDAGIKDVIKVFASKKHWVQATADHQLKTVRGWKKVGDLLADDQLYIKDVNATRPNRIWKINKKAELSRTYDLETAKYNSFFANGILTHNSGFSTAIKAKALHSAFFGKIPAVLICSASQLQATKVLREIKEAIYSMPEFLRPEFSKESETEIHLKSGSKLISLPMSPNTCRGFQGDIMCDEFGLLSRKDSEALWEAVLPALTKGYKLVAVSTPKGKNNLFYDLCNPKKDEDGNISGIRSDKVIRVHYTCVPHVKKAVEEMELDKKMPWRSFLQEYCCEFLDDEESSLFSYELILEKLIDEGLTFHNTSAIDLIEGDECPQDLIIRDLGKEFKNGIILGFDPAMVGDGSIITVFGVNGEEWKQLSLRTLPKGMTIDQQVQFASRLAHMFQAKKLAFDATAGMGMAFEESLKKTRARPILLPLKFTSTFKSQEYAKLKMRIENHQMKSPYHEQMIKEFTTLGYNPVTGRIGAMGSRLNHDDIPSAILCAHAARNKSNNTGFSFI